MSVDEREIDQVVIELEYISGSGWAEETPYQPI